MTSQRYHGTGYKKQIESKKQYSEDFLLSLYRSIFRIRLVELKIENHYHEDEMKTPIHLIIGQEAAPVGLCANLTIEDQILCTHRTHSAYLAKGGDLKAMMAEMFCRVNGCAGSRGGSMHLIDPKVGMLWTSAVVGGILPVATGSALSAKIKKQNSVTVALFGDAANEEGVTYESINFAVLKKLPIIYFCENNFFSSFSPLSKRQAEGIEIYKRFENFGIPTFQIDGTNVLDVFEVSKLAVERARKGLGPTYIEAQAYRWRAHMGSGDDSSTGYRSPDEVKDWEEHACPLKNFENYLKQINVLNEEKCKKIKQELEIEINEAFEYGRKSPYPTEKDLWKHAYAVESKIN